MFQHELSRGPSESRRPAPLSNLTNIRPASTVPLANVDPSRPSMPLNLSDSWIRIDDGDDTLTFNGASSREDIPFDDDFDEWNFDSMCRTADIPSSLPSDIHQDGTGSKENDDDRLPNTSTDFHHAPVSEAATIARIHPTLIFRSVDSILPRCISFPQRSISR